MNLVIYRVQFALWMTAVPKAGGAGVRLRCPLLERFRSSKRETLTAFLSRSAGACLGGGCLSLPFVVCAKRSCLRFNP